MNLQVILAAFVLFYFVDNQIGCHIQENIRKGHTLLARKIEEKQHREKKKNFERLHHFFSTRS